MNAGLRYLLIRTAVGKARQLTRRFRGPRGAALGLATFAVVSLLLAPQVFMNSQARDALRLGAVAESVRRWGPPGLLLVIAFLGLSRGALHFRPAEIQFLFAAPISRRQLLLYQFVSRARVQVLSALWCSVFLLQFARSWFAAVLGLFLGLVFLQSTAQASGLFAAALGERIAKPVRRTLIALGIVGAGFAFFSLRGATDEVGVLQLARDFVDHPIVLALGWIPRPFLEVFLAVSLPSMAFWAAISTGILAILVLVLVGLDLAYTEGAISQAQRIEQTLRRARSGGAFAALGPTGTRFRLPVFPFLAGAGPIGWRQCQEMCRNLRGVFLMGVMMFVWLAIFLVVPAVISESFESVATGPLANAGATTDPGDGEESGRLATLAIVMSLFMTSVLTMNFPFDFRRDVDRMAWFKSLPLAPTAIAAGQILPTTVLLVFWQTIALIVVSLVTGDIGPSIFVTVLLLLPLLDWIVAAVDNATYLLFPYRIHTKDAGNLPFMGRLMVILTVKSLVVGAIVGAAALAGFLVRSLFDAPWMLAGGAAATVLALCCLPVTLWAAAAFERFDVATDVPD